MKKGHNSALIAIDVQTDFHDVPGANLGVPGAVKDTERIAAFMKNIVPDTIFASMDSHYPLDIAHPRWFVDAKGNHPPPFTIISVDDIQNGKWTPVIDPVGTLKYVEALAANGEFLHCIWPEHCLIGSDGHKLHPVFYDALYEWMGKKKGWIGYINKGINPMTEHFGIFRANVPVANDPSTQVNQGIFQTLNNHDTIYLVGQAQTHCVANSLRQMLQIAPQLASKIVVLTDCMSPVPTLPDDFYTMVQGIYDNAASLGVRMAKSTDI